jgi:hypothetical protein
VRQPVHAYRQGARQVDGVSRAQWMGLQDYTRVVHDGLGDGNHLIALRKMTGDTLGKPLCIGHLQVPSTHSMRQRTDHFGLG